jgi:serine/threonine-protein kinase
VVTYQLISGRLPYEATSLTELALKQQREEPPTLDTLVAAVTPALGDAVAIALSLDPRERYLTAREMGRALRDGAAGIAPEESREPARAAPATQATSVLPSKRREAPARSAPPRRVQQRQPRSGPPRVQQRPARAAAAPARSRRAPRVVLALLTLAALALVVVAVVLATAPASTKITLRQVVYNDVQQSAEALKKLVSQNTK